MTDEVQFEENSSTINRSNYYKNNKEPKIIKLFLKSGLSKNDKKTNILLFSIFIILIIVFAYNYFNNRRNFDVIPYDKLSEKEKNKIPPETRKIIEDNLYKLKYPQQ